ncbi:MAG: 50S ribosomal protein L20 [Candidatus Taylorbacteria bacterium]|nr:50S ribosomal protein L20 [Candidatus Taylorbacteria bacterium]
MTRVKRGTTKNKTRKNILKMTKGYRLNRRSKEAEANTAIMHAGASAFAHRRDKKGDMRRLWNVRINAALRENGTTYSKFIGAMTKAKIEIDRKILSTLALENPEIFKKIVEKVK